MARPVPDLLGMFETTEIPRLLWWAPRPDTCEGVVCFVGVGVGVGARSRPPAPPIHRRVAFWTVSLGCIARGCSSEVPGTMVRLLPEWSPTSDMNHRVSPFPTGPYQEAKRVASHHGATTPVLV